MSEINLAQYPATRETAKQSGSVFYYTDVVCNNGHKDLRYCCSGTCRTCEKIKRKQHYAKNAEQYRSYSREWRAENADQTIAKGRAYRAARREHYRELARQYRIKYPDRRQATLEKSRDRRKAYAVKYNNENREARKAYKRKRRARELACPGQHTAADIRRLLENQNHRCINCNKSVREARMWIT